MSPEPTDHEFDEATMRRLAQLADGSLQDPERAELEADVAGSPTLAAALERQRTAVRALRDLDFQAGPALRERISSQGAAPSRSKWMPWLRIAGALAGATVAAALVAVLVSSSGGGNPTVVEAARLSERPAGAQVAVDPQDEHLLAAQVEGVAFPNWRSEFGWRSAGARSDQLHDRSTRTVFYEHDGRRVAYTIVSGDGIHAPPGSRPATVNGVNFHSFRQGDRRVVTWWRDGRTCVLSASGVSRHELLTLASWKGDGAVSF
jgi:hypothetical protein